MTNETDTTKIEQPEQTPEQKAEIEKQEAILKEKIIRANDDANRIVKFIEEKGDENKGVRWTQLFLQSLCGYIENAFMSKRVEVKVSDLKLVTDKIEEQNERDMTEFTLDRISEYNVYDAVLLLDKMNKIIENKIAVEQIKRPLSELKLSFTANEPNKDNNSKLDSKESV
jgi:hypothetical protein